MKKVLVAILLALSFVAIPANAQKSLTAGQSVDWRLEVVRKQDSVQLHIASNPTFRDFEVLLRYFVGPLEGSVIVTRASLGKDGNVAVVDGFPKDLELWGVSFNGLGLFPFRSKVIVADKGSRFTDFVVAASESGDNDGDGWFSSVTVLEGRERIIIVADCDDTSPVFHPDQEGFAITPNTQTGVRPWNAACGVGGESQYTINSGWLSCQGDLPWYALPVAVVWDSIAVTNCGELGNLYILYDVGGGNGDLCLDKAHPIGPVKLGCR